MKEQKKKVFWASMLTISGYMIVFGIAAAFNKTLDLIVWLFFMVLFAIGLCLMGFSAYKYGVLEERESWEGRLNRPEQAQGEERP